MNGGKMVLGKKLIMVVDDDTTSLTFAKNILEKEYRVSAINSGAKVLNQLGKTRPELILLDLNMPDIDGFEVMKLIREHHEYSKIPVIFLTADRNPQNESKCLESGAIDFVSKPFVPSVLESRVKRTLELFDSRKQLETMVHAQTVTIASRTERISKIQNAVIIGMANLIEERDNSTGKHVRNAQHYVEMICDSLMAKGLFPDILTDDYRNNTVKAAPLHDVGKIRIPDAILQKPGRLTPEEFEVIKTHTTIGEAIINNILGDVEESEYLEIARQIALRHHEKWDGSGYPDGLKGEEIPLCARIMAIADVFDALYEDRCYKKGIRPLRKAVDIIEADKGTHFDPDIADVFIGLYEDLLEYVGETESTN